MLVSSKALQSWQLLGLEGWEKRKMERANVSRDSDALWGHHSQLIYVRNNHT
jgi:hypothetical protein